MPRRRSLVIATSQHDDERLTNLASPASDAMEIHALLGDPRRGDFESRLLVDARARDVCRELERFFLAESNRDDLVLVFYSGHGVKDDDGNLYLTASDTSVDYVRSTAVPARFLNEMMAASRASAQIVVLDCCFSGAFAKGLTPKAAGDAGIADELRPSGGAGRVVLTASSAVQYSFEALDPVAERARSIYSGALVDGLRTGAADVGHDGVITATDWHEYASRRVQAATASQRPRMWTFDLEADPVVARVTEAGGAAAASPVTEPVVVAAAPAARAEAGSVSGAKRRRGRVGVSVVVALLVVFGSIVVWRRATDDPTRGGAKAAAFLQPVGIQVWIGALWVADCSDHRIDLVTDAGVEPVSSGSVRLDCPADITTVNDGNGGVDTYVSDSALGALVRFPRDAPASVLRPLPPPGTSLGLVSPVGLTALGTRLFIADRAQHCVFAYDVATNQLTIEVGVCNTAGTGTSGQRRDQFLFQAPDGLALWRNRLVVADTGNNRVVAVDPAGTVTVLAGSPQGLPGFAGDGAPAADARLDQPYRVAVHDGELFITDHDNGRIRKIAADGTISTVAGGGSGDPGSVGDPLEVGIVPFAITFDHDTLIFSSVGEHRGVYAVEKGRLREVG